MMLMKKPVEIRHSELKSAVRMTPLELNACRFDPKHTVLTPGLLESDMRKQKIKTAL